MVRGGCHSPRRGRSRAGGQRAARAEKPAAGQLRHGGTWCYTGSGLDDSKCTFRGGLIRFAGRGDSTMVTQDTVYQSAQDRDRVLRYDMAEDIHESIERLEECIFRSL